MKATLRILAATGLFAAVHSGVASRRAKSIASRVFGQRNRNGLYRLFYIGQSAASFGALAWYVRRQPGAVLYEIPQPLSWALRGAQVLCLGVSTIAAREVGLRRISGIESFKQWCGEEEVDPEPEAQGPAPDVAGMHVAGPFRWSRHPLNFWPLPIFWLNPRMTTNLLVFNAAATIYLVIGSTHEEARLRTAYGDKYISYQHSKVSFYVPRTRRNTTWRK
jgi:methanethiol S-methyltransferase